MKITVIGLGQMGGNMALTLHGAGFDVTGSDVFEAARQRLAEQGLATVNPESLPASDVYLLSLPTSEHVRACSFLSRGFFSDFSFRGATIVHHFYCK